MTSSTQAPASIASTLQQAITHHQAGQFPQAEQLYRAILQVQPGHADANHNLGILAGQVGHAAAGLDFLKAARDIQPSTLQFTLSYSNALLSLGRNEEAFDALQRALGHGVDSAELQNNLGNAFRSLGRTDAALAAFQRAIALLPVYAPAHYNLACTLQDLGQLDPAMQSYTRALQLDPGMVEAENNLGTILSGMGRFREAEACLRRALTQRPDYAEAHYNLGNLLYDDKQVEAAMESYRSSLACQPEFAPAHNRLGKALAERRQFSAAAASFRRALAITPGDAGIHNDLGNALLALGEMEEAENSCRRALSISPEFAPAHNNLGNVLQAREKFNDAVQCYAHALRMAPDFAEAHNNLGQALQHLDQFDNAILSYRRALESNPHFAVAYLNLALVQKYQSAADAEASCRKALEIQADLPEALIFLADLIASKGQFAEAEALLRRAIEIVPDSPEAWSAITGLRKMTAGDADWLRQAEDIAATNLPARKEIFLRYAMGKYHDDLKNFDEAFQQYRRANELAKSYGKRYDAKREEHNVDRLLRIYNQQWLDANRVDANASALPVFVVGMPRSGTSLTEQIIASHPSAAGAGELEYWQLALAGIMAQEADDTAFPELSNKLISDYLGMLTALSPNTLRVVDKMPSNFRCLGLMHAAFPQARIIHMQRNPVDTCLSIYFQHFESFHAYGNDLEDLAHYYRQYMRVMKHWRTLLPRHALLDVPYEQMVADHTYWSRRIIDFIGLPWDTHCIDFQDNQRAVSTASKWQVRQKINSTSVQRWRHYEQFIGPLLPLQDEM